ncbi:hypothetical protein B0H11DRAFT_1916511 [Mycena galericulata]|nr:hypothetical protein B0H11DRAFT_1916511 [Mycena galericulata]
MPKSLKSPKKLEGKETSSAFIEGNIRRRHPRNKKELQIVSETQTLGTVYDMSDDPKLTFLDKQYHSCIICDSTVKAKANGNGGRDPLARGWLWTPCGMLQARLAPGTLKGLESHGVAWNRSQEPDIRAASHIKPNDLATASNMSGAVAGNLSFSDMNAVVRFQPMEGEVLGPKEDSE